MRPNLNIPLYAKQPLIRKPFFLYNASLESVQDPAGGRPARPEQRPAREAACSLPHQKVRYIVHTMVSGAVRFPRVRAAEGTRTIQAENVIHITLIAFEELSNSNAAIGAAGKVALWAIIVIRVRVAIDSNMGKSHTGAASARRRKRFPSAGERCRSRMLGGVRA